MAKTLIINGIDYSIKTEDRPYCLPLKETGGQHIYVAYEDYKAYMDMLSDEATREDYLTRCAVPGKNGKLIVCRHRCDECPYKNAAGDPFENRKAVSADHMKEERDVEARSDDDILADIYIAERKAKLAQELSLLSEYQQELIKLWSNNCTLQFMAEKLKVSKSKIDRDIDATIAILKEKMKDF